MKLTPLCLALGVVACGGPPPAEPPPPPAEPSLPEAPAPAVDDGFDASAVYLQALVPTSGGGAEVVLDGDPATAWRPLGEAVGEGLLLRLEAPRAVSAVRVTACPDFGADEPPRFEAEVYANGSLVDGAITVLPGASGDLPLPGEGVRSVFVKIAEATAGACVGPGDGESLSVTLDAAAALTGLEIWNGYQRSEDHFQKNARVHEVAVSADGQSIGKFSLTDEMGPQTLTFEEPVTARALTMTVLSVYPGSRYTDLVVSELRLLDAHGPLTVTTPHSAERMGALADQIEGQSLERLLDREWVGRCAEDSERRLKLRSNFTFVWYDMVEGPDGSYTEIFDGAWVVNKQAKPWSELQLYGRIHRSESVWQPYGGDETTEAVRVGGGKIEAAFAAGLREAGFGALLTEWGRDERAARVGCLTEKGAFATLAASGAMVVRGAAITDLLVPARGEGG